MPRLSKVGAACLAAFGWTTGGVSQVTANFLVIAGGAGGGNDRAGGGGAGGLRSTVTATGGGGSLEPTITLNPIISYTVTVGAGGAGSTSVSSAGTNGSDSVLSGTGITTITSTGGGGGGSGSSVNGVSGGSGGGARNQNSATGGAGTANQGFAGGSNTTNDGGTGGGGGGAGAVGKNGNPETVNRGFGGAGVATSITGSSVTYAGGGGAGGDGTTFGTGGSGGGGNGGSTASATGNGNPGTANLGGGGGGGDGAGTTRNGGQGGSGVVIISYVGAQQFGGGIVTSSGSSTIHTFTTSGTLSPLSSLTVSTLVVAGGGGGGAGNGGAGGAGGYRTGSGITIDTNSIYLVTVGAGGNGGANPNRGTSGTDSLAFAITSAGGGGGGSGTSPNLSGIDGGSGGGGSGGNAGGNGNTPSTSPSQGNNGGTGSASSPNYGAGGGGGATGTGGTGTSTTGGNGGSGTANSISGSSVTYAGGGGGGTYDTGGTAGSGGSGGGGAGSTNATVATAGTANLGGGGGGGGASTVTNGTGGAGGSGVVIISYSGSVQLMAGGTVTVAGGNVIHTFTSSGFLTPIVLTTNSLRFRNSASAYLNRTPTTASNRKTFTWSAWVKLGTIDASNGTLFSAGTTSGVSTRFYLRYVSSIFQTGYGSQNLDSTVAVYRDPSAWYHVVLAVDTTQATASNRIKIYVNGVQQAVTTSVNYSQNDDTAVNNTVSHQIASDQIIPGGYFDGYMTEINFIDGQALTPFSFGETSTSTGVWIPKKYTGTYGTNGFYLPFTNTASTSTLGNDFSGNSNTWTVNNISLTAGSTYDSMTDVPTLTSATTANYCVANPLEKGSAFTVSNGNLTIDINASKPVFASVKGTFGITSGKWYWECVKTSSGSGLSQSGVWASDNLSLNINSDLNGNLASLNNIGMFGSTAAGDLIKTGLNSQDYATLGSYTNGDVIGIAFDADSGKLYAYKNGTEFTGQAIGSGTSILPTMATGKTYQPFVYSGNGGSGTENATTNINFGQRPFAYTPPSGFVRLNTFNLPTPTIGATAAELANEYFDATLYTGNGSTQTITNSGSMQPDFVWIKNRGAAHSHQLYDVVRGVGSGKSLKTNNTDQEGTFDSLYGYVSALNSNGFSVAKGSDVAYFVNDNNVAYVGWQWRASNTTAVTNTAGSITSTVSASTTAGFSIVTYTGTGSNATVGHGLGVAPSMFIVKRRNAGTNNWLVYHQSIGGTGALYLNTTEATQTFSDIWNNTAPTSTVFSIGTTNNANQSTGTYVAYCFAQVAGYSAFGSYTGNGSSDGIFIFTGFRPRYILIKSTGVQDWIVWDTARDTYNASQNFLLPNKSDSESGGIPIDFVSNGIKIRTANGTLNSSGVTYIYMAFAETPLKFSNAR